jgi:hypothetical protein
MTNEEHIEKTRRPLLEVFPTSEVRRLRRRPRLESIVPRPSPRHR